MEMNLSWQRYDVDDIGTLNRYNLSGASQDVMKIEDALGKKTKLGPHVND